MRHYTLDDLSRFTQNERKMVNELFAESECSTGPSENSLDRIMDYSRAYSARRSGYTGFIRMVLN